LRTNFDRWLWIPCPRPQAAFRLYCFAHAGAGASAFASWGAAAPRDVEIAAIQLPGRENRLAEPLLHSFAPAAISVGELIAAEPDFPFALFGHSAGARLAVRVASFVLDRRLPLMRLFLSGASCDPPTDAIYTLNGPEFIRRITARYGELPPQLTADPKIWTIFERVLKADLEAVETDVLGPRPLPTPITIISGRRDRIVDHNSLCRWQSWSEQEVCYEILDADHYSYRQEPGPYLSAIMRHLIRNVS
jgi:medium-chain acyl-[acyl-carrier-protein] hydrolase